ncbi:MAG: PASTA domain-containing protein [Planctomycetota bacterium]
MLIAAYEIADPADKQAYLDRAYFMGDQAMLIFLDGTSPLPKASSQTNHYEAITGGPVLMRALMELSGVQSVTVPDVTGQDQATAEGNIVAAGLIVGTVTTSYSGSVPAGDVISQNPTGGATVPPGTSVDIEVSLGTLMVTVPDVVGLAQAAAESDIVAAGLVAAVTTSYSETVPAGEVISQNPVGSTSVLIGSSVDIEVSLGVEPNTKLSTGIAEGVGSSGWTTVNLAQSYTSMVVVGVANYDNTDGPGAVRIQNASGSSFDVRVDAAGGAALSGIDVHYMVVEEGVYTVAADGVKMEAVKYLSTVTDQDNSWTGQAQTYSNSYTSPVVLGQVMTYNDSDFSTFWCYGSSRKNPPDTTNLVTGKSVAEDKDTTRSDETIGYIVIEAGSGTINNTDYVAALGGDTVKGTTDAPPYNYTISGLTSPTAAVASLSAMDGGNGGWAVLYGANPLSDSTLNLAIEEDTIKDTERKHTNEQVAYIIFETAPEFDPPTPDPAAFAVSPAVDSDSSISMTAITGTDESGPVQYLFTEISGNPGGSSSGWTTSASYTDTGLTGSTEYTYTVQMRDSLSNTGYASADASATTHVTVPDVVGLTQATAQSNIVAANLVVGTVSTSYSFTVPVGDVISQSPTGGSSALPGTSVDIEVSLGIEQVVVPDVVTQDKVTATANIVAAQLVANVIEVFHATIPVDQVISQTPTGGASVDIEVSLGVQMVTVPDVVGLAQATAEADIVAAGLVAAVTTSISATVPAGDVISQNPVGSTSVAIGSSVDIEVSLGVEPSIPDAMLGWHLNENSGTTAFDYDGTTAYDGTFVGSPIWQADYVEFDGNLDSIENTTVAGDINGLAQVTVSVWVKSDSASTDRGFLFDKNPAGTDGGFGMRYDKDGGQGDLNVIKCNIITTGGNSGLESSVNVQTTSWQHLVMRWQSGSKTQLFINGVLNTPTEDATARTGTITGVTKLVLGRGGKDNRSGEGWDGGVDAFKIYDVYLTDQEIADLFNLGRE